MKKFLRKIIKAKYSSLYFLSLFSGVIYGNWKLLDIAKTCVEEGQEFCNGATKWIDVYNAMAMPMIIPLAIFILLGAFISEWESGRSVINK